MIQNLHNELLSIHFFYYSTNIGLGSNSSLIIHESVGIVLFSGEIYISLFMYNNGYSINQIVIFYILHLSDEFSIRNEIINY